MSSKNILTLQAESDCSKAQRRISLTIHITARSAELVASKVEKTNRRSILARDLRYLHVGSALFVFVRYETSLRKQKLRTVKADASCALWAVIIGDVDDGGNTGSGVTIDDEETPGSGG